MLGGIEKKREEREKKRKGNVLKLAKVQIRGKFITAVDCFEKRKKKVRNKNGSKISADPMEIEIENVERKKKIRGNTGLYNMHCTFKERES